MSSYQYLGLVIDSTNPSAGAVNGTQMAVQNESGLSVQTEWTGTVNGAFRLQSRNDESLSWRDVTQVVFTAAAGSAGGEVIEVGNARSRFYRIVYTHASGTGTVKVAVHAKGGF